MAKKLPPGERLKAWRIEAGLSQADAAKLGRISQPAWCGYERGRYPKGLEIASRLDDLTKGSKHHVEATEWLPANAQRTSAPPPRAA